MKCDVCDIKEKKYTYSMNVKHNIHLLDECQKTKCGIFEKRLMLLVIQSIKMMNYMRQMVSVKHFFVVFMNNSICIVI